MKKSINTPTCEESCSHLFLYVQRHSLSFIAKKSKKYTAEEVGHGLNSLMWAALRKTRDRRLPLSAARYIEIRASDLSKKLTRIKIRSLKNLIHRFEMGSGL